MLDIRVVGFDLFLYPIHLFAETVDEVFPVNQHKSLQILGIPDRVGLLNKTQDLLLQLIQNLYKE